MVCKTPLVVLSSATRHVQLTRVTTEYLDTQLIMSMITDSGDEYEYQQDLLILNTFEYLPVVLNTFEYRFGLSMSMSIACQERV